MKNKFIIFTLCFTLIFSSISINNNSYAYDIDSYAFDGGVVSVPLIATVVTLGVASGVIIKNSDDITKIATDFYNYHKENYDNVKAVFDACVLIGANKVVTVGKEFLEFVKEFYDSYFNDDVLKLPTVGGIPIVEYSSDTSSKGVLWNRVFSGGIKISEDVVSSCSDFTVGNALFKFSRKNSSNYYYDLYVDGVLVKQSTFNLYGDFYFAVTERPVGGSTPSGQEGYQIVCNSGQYCSFKWSYDGGFTGTLDIPIDGVYVPGGVLDSDNVGVYVPGNASDLVGVGSSDVIYDGVLNPPYDLPVGGAVTVPGIGEGTFGDSVTDFPDTDIPSEGLWSSITDYIIGLVVPSDTFWTDTWGGLYNNFVDSFPMVDMSGFDDLVTGEKKFPNIDIDIMGITGRVVNGDVINSIVDWLRPIIAGFMMICLMLFNYRKIYKLIRNTEPFGGIASGTSDFKTGISEYTHVGLVNDGFKRSEEEEFARSRYYEEMHFKNGGKL